MDLSELLAKQDGGDFIRTVAEAVLQLLMEADVEGLIGAGKHERSSERTTRLGRLNLRVPKLRQGSCFPGFLEPRKTSEKALVAVIQGEGPVRHWFEHGPERDRRRLDPPRGRTGTGDGPARDLQKRGVEAVQGY